MTDLHPASSDATLAGNLAGNLAGDVAGTIGVTDAADRSAATTAARPTGAVQRFHYFRRSRPFWGAIVLALGAWFIARPVMSGSMEFYTTVGVRGMTPMIIAGGMGIAAAVSLVVPAQRHFPALVAAMLSVASLPLANLGGWVIGMTLGIVGAGLIFAWTPYTPDQLARFAERDAARAARRARHSRKDAR